MFPATPAVSRSNAQQHSSIGYPGPALPPLPMAAPSQPAWDLIYFAGPGVDVRHAQVLGQHCKTRGLTLRAIGPADMPLGLWPMIQSLHVRGELRDRTHVELDWHGSMLNGVHKSTAVSSDSPVNTLAAVRELRQSGIRLGLPPFKGSIGLHMCFDAYLSQALENDEGIHAVCGGKKTLYSHFGLEFMLALLPLLQAAKHNAAGLTARAMFDALAAIAPCTVSVVGKGLPPLVKHVRMPSDLAGASEQCVKDAFKQRISVGKVAQVEAFIHAWPELLSMPIAGYPSAFGIAYDLGRPEMIEFFLARDEVDWQANLHCLLPLVKSFPYWSVRVSVLINRALLQALKRAFVPSTAPCAYPDPLDVVARQAQTCLSLRNIFDVQPLEITLTLASAPTDANAACDWDLVDMIGFNAAVFLGVPPSQVARFKDELRLRVLSLRHAALSQKAPLKAP